MLLPKVGDPMHEVGVVMQVIQTVEEFAREHKVEQIDSLVLQIGELSSMIPRYIEAVYPAAADGTMLENTALKIEILPANAICQTCNKVFEVIKHNGVCPKCNGKNIELLGGKEFFIKEIVCY